MFQAGHLFFIFLFQIFELCFQDDAEAAAVRGRPQEADGAAEEELRGHEDVRAGAAPRKTSHQQNSQGKTTTTATATFRSFSLPNCRDRKAVKK